MTMGVDAREARESVWICAIVSLERLETDRLDQLLFISPSETVTALPLPV